MAPTTRTLLFSSESSSNRTKLSTDGSELTVYFEPAFSVPASAKTCTVSLIKASVVNSFDNIIDTAGKENNKLYYKKPGDVTNTVTTLQAGMYSVTELSTAVNKAIRDKELELANPTVEDDPFLIEPEYTTNDIVLTVLVPGWSIDFTQSQTFNNVLGYTAIEVGVDPDPVTANTSVYRSTDVSTFTDFPALVLRSSLSKSFYNGGISNVLEQFDMLSSIGFINVYQPYYLNRTDGSQLIGKQTTEAVFTLENAKGKRPVINDVWTLTVELQYE
jgi:hypothetical protein